MLPARILNRIVVTESGCWQWLGCRGNKEGHGQVYWRGKMVYVHRLAYAFKHGRVPGGKYVCHTCDNPPCCNPDHLIAGSARTNLRHQYQRFRRSKKPQELIAK